MRSVRSLSGLAGSGASLKDAGGSVSAGGVWTPTSNTKYIANVRAAQMNPTGTKLYTQEIISGTSAGTYEYDLAEPFDLSTAGARMDPGISRPAQYWGAIQWKADGTKFMILGYAQVSSYNAMYMQIRNAVTPWSTVGSTYAFQVSEASNYSARGVRISLDDAVLYFHYGRYYELGPDWDVGGWTGAITSYDGAISGVATGDEVRELNEDYALTVDFHAVAEIKPLNTPGVITGGLGAAVGRSPVLSDITHHDDTYGGSQLPELVGVDEQYWLTFNEGYVNLMRAA